MRPKWGQISVIALSIFVMTIDFSSIGVALPSIARQFGVDLPAAQWVILASILTMAAVIIPCGRLADRFGRRRLALTGLTAYGTLAVVAALSPTLSFLIAVRVIQSLGAALVQANALALLANSFPVFQRGRAMGVNGTVIAAGLLAGPIIGGLLTGFFGWRFVLLAIAPLALVAVILGWRYLPKWQSGLTASRFDWIGAVLMILWTGPLVLALNMIAVAGPLSPIVIASTGTGAISLFAFIVRQLRAEAPLVDLRVLKIPRFSLAIISGWAGFAVIGAQLLMTPFLLDQVLALQPQLAGIIIACYPLGAVLVAFRAGAFVDRFGERIPAVAGLLVMGSGLLLLVGLGPESQPWEAAVRLFWAGLGQGLFASPNAASIMGALPARQANLASASNTWMRTLSVAGGQAVAGLAFASVVFSLSSVDEALTAPPSITRWGYAAVFAGGAAICALGALLAAVRPNQLQTGQSSHPF